MTQLPSGRVSVLQGSFTRGHQWKKGMLGTQDVLCHFLQLKVNWPLKKDMAVTCVESGLQCCIQLAQPAGSPAAFCLQPECT